MVDERWRVDELHINSNAPAPRYWCSILSPEGHKYCDKPYFCGCECHLPDTGHKEARWRKREGKPYDPFKVRVAGVRA
jgi:hypothetical protein